MSASSRSETGSPVQAPSIGLKVSAQYAPWLVLAGAIVASLYVHELGHCLVAWLNGCPAIPTPAKEYLLRPVTPEVQNQVAVGGIVGSIVSLVAAIAWLWRRPSPTRSALLAGHDGTEFQEAQAILGFDYAGHAVDWLFVALFAMATALWFWRVRPHPTVRLAGRLLLGAMVALVILVLLQVVNNAVFDPLFSR
jgi:hypothetical protein